MITQINQSTKTRQFNKIESKGRWKSVQINNYKEDFHGNR